MYELQIIKVNTDYQYHDYNFCIFGLIRDIVIGAFFGPGLGIDVFIVSFRIPNFLRRLFAEGGFSQAFVPILSEYKEKRKDEDVQKLIDQTSATLGLILFDFLGVKVSLGQVFSSFFEPMSLWAEFS